MRALALASLSALLLSACMTTQENPNYEFSSRYDAEQARLAQVNEPSTIETPRVAAQSLPTAYVAPVSAPTDDDFGSEPVTGTPGAMILAAQQVEIEATTSVTAQPVDYDYSQNLIFADVPVAQPDLATQTHIRVTGEDYTVQPGDTVYSLSRKRCVGIDVVRGLNQIGTDYAIDIGQTLKLPASAC